MDCGDYYKIERQMPYVMGDPLNDVNVMYNVTRVVMNDVFVRIRNKILAADFNSDKKSTWPFLKDQRPI